MKKNSNENNFALEEEKKESSPRRDALTAPKLEVLSDPPPSKTADKDVKIGEPDSKLNFSDDGFPSELEGKTYADEDELWKHQEEIGLSDLDIVLDSEGYAVWREMSGTFHNRAVDAISIQFMNWKQEQGAAFYFKTEAEVYVSKSFQKKINRRRPDFAIWGPSRLDDDKSIQGNVELRKEMNPHVIFQFSWANGLDQEKLAINDMSMYAGTSDLEPLGRPNVIYLIKAIRKKRTENIAHGFDVYEVRQKELTENVTKMTYKVGGEEGSIIVAHEVMGLENDPNPFSIELSRIRAEMEKVGVVFEAENEDE